MVRGVHISDLPSVSTVTEDLNLLIDTEEGLKKTSLGDLKQFMRIPNVQAQKTITENGTYEADTDDKVYFGLQWWGTSKSGYTGDKTLIGDYIWFNRVSLFDIEVGDIGYNGKYKDENEEEVIPDITQPLGAVSQKEILKDVAFSFNSKWNFELSGNLIEIDNNTYYKVRISDNAKTDCTVDIVGNFVWVPAENIYTPQYGTYVYNSIDSMDTVPDLSASIGTLSYVKLVSLLHLDFVNNYGFGNRSSSGTNTVIHNKIYDGIAKVIVDVPTYEDERNRLLTGSIFENYTLPDNITYLHDYGLAYQYSLSIVNTNNVTYAGPYAFYQCANLKSAILPNLYTISEYMFEYCKQLQSVIMPNVSSIYRSCFNNCTSLTNIDLSNITYMTGNYRFYNCTSLSNIIMPNIQYNVNEYDFYKCTSLENIYLKDVYRIYSNAFRDCTNLKYVNFGTNITTINSNSFYGCNQEDLILEFGLTEAEFNNKSGLVNYKPWGATNATILYADSNAHNFKITCLNEGIVPEVILSLNGKALKVSETRQADGTEITYTVKYRNYITQTGTVTLNEDMDIKILLEEDPNPKYYEIDENSVSWSGENIEVIQNEYTDNTTLKITNLTGSENIIINDSEWNNYFENFGNPTLNTFQELADEFVFTFKINHTYTGYSILSGNIITTIDDNNDGIYLYLYRNGLSDVKYYSYLYMNGNDISEDWRNDGVTYPVNETLTIHIKYNNGWSYTLNNSNTWSNANSNPIQVFTKIFGYMHDIAGFSNSTIEVDFMNTGLKKNGEWVWRPVKEQTNHNSLTINTVPSSATVIINGCKYSSGQTINLPNNTEVTWKVEAENYAAQTNTLTLTENTTLNITLNSVIYAWDPEKLVLSKEEGAIYELAEDSLGNSVLLRLYETNKGVNSSPLANPFYLEIGGTPRYTYNSIAGGLYESSNYPATFELKFKILNQSDIWDNMYLPILGSRMGDGSYSYDETSPKTHKGDGILFDFNNKELVCLSFWQPEEGSHTSTERGKIVLNTSHEYTNEWTLTLAQGSIKLANGNGLYYENTIVYDSYQTDDEYGYFYAFLNTLFQGGYTKDINANIEIDLLHTGFKDRNGDWMWRPIKVIS